MIGHSFGYGDVDLGGRLAEVGRRVASSLVAFPAHFGADLGARHAIDAAQLRLLVECGLLYEGDCFCL